MKGILIPGSQELTVSEFVTVLVRTNICSDATNVEICNY